MTKPMLTCYHLCVITSIFDNTTLVICDPRNMNAQSDTNKAFEVRLLGRLTEPGAFHGRKAVWDEVQCLCR